MKLHLAVTYLLLTSFASCSIMQNVEKKKEGAYTIIMDLAEGISPDELTKKFADFNLTDFKRISKSQNKWSAKINSTSKKEVKNAIAKLAESKQILSIKMSDDSIDAPTNSSSTKKGKATIKKEN